MAPSLPTFHRLAEALEEVTLSGNAGAFPIPMGPVLARQPRDPKERTLPTVEYEVPEAYRALYR